LKYRNNSLETEKLTKK